MSALPRHEASCVAAITALCLQIRIKINLTEEKCLSLKLACLSKEGFVTSKDVLRKKLCISTHSVHVVLLKASFTHH